MNVATSTAHDALGHRGVELPLSFEESIETADQACQPFACADGHVLRFFFGEQSHGHPCEFNWGNEPAIVAGSAHPGRQLALPHSGECPDLISSQRRVSPNLLLLRHGLLIAEVALELVFEVPSLLGVHLFSSDDPTFKRRALSDAWCHASGRGLCRTRLRN